MENGSTKNLKDKYQYLKSNKSIILTIQNQHI